MTDVVNHPPHYTSHPSGVECITITEHMGFNLGNALKYIWRADEKGAALQDLEKARWYIDREIAKRRPPVKAIADLEVLWIPSTSEPHATIDGLRVTWDEAVAFTGRRA